MKAEAKGGKIVGVAACLCDFHLHMYWLTFEDKNTLRTLLQYNANSFLIVIRDS